MSENSSLGSSPCVKSNLYGCDLGVNLHSALYWCAWPELWLPPWGSGNSNNTYITGLCDIPLYFGNRGNLATLA